MSHESDPVADGELIIEGSTGKLTYQLNKESGVPGVPDVPMDQALLTLTATVRDTATDRVHTAWDKEDILGKHGNMYVTATGIGTWDFPSTLLAIFADKRSEKQQIWLHFTWGAAAPDSRSGYHIINVPVLRKPK